MSSLQAIFHLKIIITLEFKQLFVAVWSEKYF